MRKLDVGQHIVVGTPGRVFDMISRKVLRANEIKQFVLDEADEMLSRGFKDQIYDVFRHLNQEIQVTFKTRRRKFLWSLYSVEIFILDTSIPS